MKKSKKSKQSTHPRLYRALHPSPIGKTVVYLPDDYAAFGHSILIDATNSHGDKFKDGGYRPLRPGSRWLFKMPKAQVGKIHAVNYSSQDTDTNPRPTVHVKSAAGEDCFLSDDNQIALGTDVPRRLDFYINNKVIGELKAFTKAFTPAKYESPAGKAAVALDLLAIKGIIHRLSAENCDDHGPNSQTINHLFGLTAVPKHSLPTGYKSPVLRPVVAHFGLDLRNTCFTLSSSFSIRVKVDDSFAAAIYGLDKILFTRTTKDQPVKIGELFAGQRRFDPCFDGPLYNRGLMSAGLIHTCVIEPLWITPALAGKSNAFLTTDHLVSAIFSPYLAAFSKIPVFSSDGNVTLFDPPRLFKILVQTLLDVRAWVNVTNAQFITPEESAGLRRIFADLRRVPEYCCWLKGTPEAKQMPTVR